MRIALVNHSHILGSGIDHVAHNLAKELGKRNEVTVYTYNSEIQGENYEVVTIGLPMANNRIISGVLSPLCFSSVRAMRTRLKYYDVAISQMYPACLLPLLPSKISKSVYIEWGVQAINLFARPSEKAYIWALQKAHGYAIKHSDIVITPSVEVEEMVKSKYHRTPSNLNLYGVDFEYFDKDKADAEVVYRKYPQLRDKKIVLFAGRVSPHKNIHTLIRAMWAVKQRIPESMLLLVGRPSFSHYDRELDCLIQELCMEDTVIRAGLVSREDLPSYFKCASLFGYCSEWEGLLNPEPLAMGLPMVCHDTPTNRQTVDDYVTGRLVQDNTPKAYANVIANLLSDNDKLREMSQNAYVVARERFDYKVIAQKLEEVISA